MSWLKPYLRTWYQQYPESVPPMGQLAHVVKRLAKVAPEERIVEELAAYLRKTPKQFLNLPKFAATFGSWATPEPVKARPAHYQSADEADARAGIPLRGSSLRGKP